jgi:nucleotide-binding universal stress UspA family protein
MTLFQKILFATDFSETSINALDYVVGLKDAGCEEVVLVHVIDIRAISMVYSEPSGFIEPSGTYDEQVARWMYRNAEEKLSALSVTLKDAGLKVTSTLIDGIPYQEIVRIADAEGVSLIIVGSHGRSDIAQMLLGSVSENVIRHARQPVLVIRRETGR